MTLIGMRSGEAGGATVAGGPSATADWLALTDESGRGRPLQGLPDGTGGDAAGATASTGGNAFEDHSGGDSGLIHVIGAPSLEAFADGSPAFGLTLTLKRQPGPHESSLVPLVTGGVASLTVTINPTEADLLRVSTRDREARRIFPASVRFALRRRIPTLGAAPNGPGEPTAPVDSELAEALVDGPAGTGAVSTTLSRDDALEVLGAIDGQVSFIEVAAEVAFRAVAAPTPPLRVTIDLARAHDRLARAVDRGWMIDEMEIPGLLAALIDEGLVGVEGLPADQPAIGATGLATILHTGLLRGLMSILSRVPGMADEGGRYRLGSRPSDGAQMTYEQRRTEGGIDRTVALARPLADILRGLTADRPLDAFVRAVCPAPDGSLQPIATRTRTVRSGPSDAGGDRLAVVGTRSVAMPAVLRTSSTPLARASVLAASDIAIRRPGMLHAWAVNDLVLATPAGGERLESLPVIEGDGSLWRDRIDGNRFWYEPELAILAPDPMVAAASSPYLFSFRVVGHDSEGRPGLEATIRLTLGLGMSAAATAAWDAKGRPTVQPVPLNGLSVALQVPFRGEDGTTSSQQIGATDLGVSPTTVVATFSLTDKWARLAYGALSRPGFQAQPARVMTSYAFPAYVPVEDGGGRIDWGGKIAAVTDFNRLTLAPPPGPDDPGPDWVMAENVAAVGGRAVSSGEAGFAWAADVRIDRVAGSSNGDGGSAERLGLPRGVPKPHAVSPLAMQLAVNHLAVHPLPPAVVVHPILVAPVHILPAKTYGIRTEGRTSQLDALLPCATLGSLYVQGADPAAGETSGDLEIGCRDAWTLGQLQLRLYEQVTVDLGISDPGFTVHRSLQVPGRFLVLPKAYTIARYEPGDDRAYRPAVYLFSTVDAVHPERSSCIVMATLGPAVTPANRRALFDALKARFHPSPSLEWPTDLQSTPTYQWAIATGGSASAQVAPAVAKTPEGFQVSLATGIDGILQLKAILERGGITAAVSFPLADGQALSSSLVIDLGRIDGPWDAGAVDATVAQGTATITNRVERPADVSGVLAYKAALPVGAVPLERRLGPAAAAAISVPEGTDEVVPRYTLVSGPTTIDEVRTFIEDIYTNVVFKSTVDLALNGLTGLLVEGRIVGVAGSGSVTLDAASTSADLGFVLPLTTYLANPTLQYRVTAVADGASTPGEWHDWRLDSQGSVVVISTAS